MERPVEKKRNHIWDVCLVAGFLLLALVLYFFLGINQEGGAGVIVAVNGEEVARYSLTEYGTFALNGGTNTLKIEGGKAWLTHANCPDSLCVKQGKIASRGQVITCLPNKLTVTVYGGESGDVDLIG